MLLVTDYRNEAEKFYYAGDGQMNEALLAVLKRGWKKFFSKWNLTVDPQDIRYHFTQDNWDMGRMDDTLFDQLPESIQKKFAGVRNGYRLSMERLERKVEMVNAAKTLVEAPKEEALKMTIKVNGKTRPLVAVVAEELNEILKTVSNDGYNSTALYEVRKTEKF